MARRSTTSEGSSEGAPCTWQRKPSSAYLSAREMPDFASRRLAVTSVLLPIDETMPIPVTTTRLMPASSAFPAAQGTGASRSCGACAAALSVPRRLRRAVLEQRDLEVARLIDQFAVRLEPAVRNAEHEFGAHHPLDVDAVDHFLDL